MIRQGCFQSFIKVIAVGAGRIKKDGTKIPLGVKKGDRVLYAKYAGTEVNIDGEEYLMMKEDDVLAIIECSWLRNPRRNRLHRLCLQLINED